jgi:polysaccharide biosynthesis/export protein
VRVNLAALESLYTMYRIPNFLTRVLSLALVPVVFGFLQGAVGQDSKPSQDPTHQEGSAQQQNPSKEVQAPPTQPPPDDKSTPIEAHSAALTLGPGDEMDVAVYGAPDLSGHTRVSSDGNISMPLVGYIHVAGLTSSEAEAAIESHLRQNNIVNDPQVSIFVKDYNSSGVSVAGEVAKPGTYTTLGPHRLFDLLQAAGGTTEKAANRAIITHRGSDSPITVELSKDPAQMAQSNIDIEPGDTVVVPAGAIVYVLGEVGKPGGYVLGSGNGVTVLRVVAAAGGPTRDASLGGARMIRRTPNGLQEVPVPLKNLLRAKTADIPLQADDILFVPNSRFKEIVNASALVSGLGTAALYRIP